MKVFRLIVLFNFLALFLNGCGGCGDTAGAGEVCEPNVDEPCEEYDFELACLEDDGENRCLHPAGGRCSDEDDLCPGDASCTSRGGESRCYLNESSTCDPENDLCADGLTCAETESEDYKCHPYVYVQGSVIDAETLDAIEGAHVIAFNEEGSALSDVAITDGDGHYSIQIPALRDEEGEPVEQYFTLRSAAADYLTFPSGIRSAQPIDASHYAAHEDEDDDRWVIDTAQTKIALLPLPDAEQGNASIHGVVDIEDGLGGVLVVAESGDDEGISGVSALDGSFTIFNVPPGSYEVRGYIADYQIEPESVEMEEKRVEDVILVRSENGIQDLTGQIQIVAAGGGLRSSVVLMVASTFDEISVRGEVPAGLRAPRTGTPDIDGSWSIEGVPAGEYYVLAGFENDELVRDPDEGLSGTDLVRVTVPAEEGSMEVTPSFKVTAALATVNPGTTRPEGLTEAPTLIWGPASNAQWYDVVVFNAFGEIVWEAVDIQPAGGSANLEAEYEGPFEEGMYYQFRTTAYRQASAISTTETLRGVFFRE